MKTEAFRIGDLARDTGTKVVTIRYYEKIGLLQNSGRSEGNYRIYGAAELNRLRFIRRCRALGFSLDQIRELADLAEDTERSCAEVDALTRRHLQDIQTKIADLQALEEELQSISSQCQGSGTISSCRIVEAISPAA